MAYNCPVCGRKFSIFCRASKIYLAFCGGGDAVCTKCAKEKKDEIEKHNEIYYGRKGAKKDPDCEHKWKSPYRGRWFCVKCGAQFNWMCGCGGSAYVCEYHYIEMITKNQPIKEYLAKYAW